jgi:hypothetical protein
VGEAGLLVEPEPADSKKPKRLDKELLESLRQGEVLGLNKLPRLLSLKHPLTRAESRGAPLNVDMVSVELPLDPALVVVISQDCDLVRNTDREPYLQIAPLTRVATDLYEQIGRFGSNRFFTYPPLAEETALVVDVRAVGTIEKPALLSSEIKRLGCPLTEPQRSKLRAWLGARYARVAFPSEITQIVVEPITKAAADLAKDENFKRAFQTVHYAGLRYTEGAEGIALCSLLVLVDPGASVRLGVDKELLESLRRKLFGRIATGLKGTGYSVSVTVANAEQISAAEMLTHHSLKIGDIGDS